MSGPSCLLGWLSARPKGGLRQGARLSGGGSPPTRRALCEQRPRRPQPRRQPWRRLGGRQRQLRRCSSGSSRSRSSRSRSSSCQQQLSSERRQERRPSERRQERRAQSAPRPPRKAKTLLGPDRTKPGTPAATSLGRRAEAVVALVPDSEEGAMLEEGSLSLSLYIYIFFLSWSRCLLCSWTTTVEAGQFASDRDAVTDLLRNALG